jgi:hypothetical protein
MPLQCVFYLRIDFLFVSSNENLQHFVKGYCANGKTEIENRRFMVQSSGKGREAPSVAAKSNGKGREAPSVPCAVCLRTLYCTVY